jgi:hypothetical protein
MNNTYNMVHILSCEGHNNSKAHRLFVGLFLWGEISGVVGWDGLIVNYS